jgi:hypothetical protein
MLKKRVITLITAFAPTIAMAGATTVVADSVGLSLTLQAQACGGTGSGGGC